MYFLKLKIISGRPQSKKLARELRSILTFIVGNNSISISSAFLAQTLFAFISSAFRDFIALVNKASKFDNLTKVILMTTNAITSNSRLQRNDLILPAKRMM